MKVFNYVWIFLTGIFVFLLSTFFWLGTIESINELKNDLVLNTFFRGLGYIIVGLISMLILVFINYLVIHDIKRSIKIGLYGLIIVFIFSLTGAFLFFNH